MQGIWKGHCYCQLPLTLASSDEQIASGLTTSSGRLSIFLYTAHCQLLERSGNPATGLPGQGGATFPKPQVSSLKPQAPSFTAIASISSSAPIGNAATCTVDRAGGSIVDACAAGTNSAKPWTTQRLLRCEDAPQLWLALSREPTCASTQERLHRGPRYEARQITYPEPSPFARGPRSGRRFGM